MGEFNDCGLWMKLAFLMSCVGFVLDLFGMSMGLGGGGASGIAAVYLGGGGGGNGRDVDGLLVAGFLFFLAAAALLLVIVHLDEMKASKIAVICFIVMAFLAGLLTIVGIADWRGRYNAGGGSPYSTMVGCVGSLLIILAAIFAILDLVGVKAGGGGGGGKSDASTPA